MFSSCALLSSCRQQLNVHGSAFQHGQHYPVCVYMSQRKGVCISTQSALSRVYTWLNVRGSVFQQSALSCVCTCLNVRGSAFQHGVHYPVCIHVNNFNIHPSKSRDSWRNISKLFLPLLPLYGHYTEQSASGGTPVKNWRILLEQSFTARMPLLTFGLGRRR